MTMGQHWLGKTKLKQVQFQIDQKRFQKVATEFFNKIIWRNYLMELIFYWLTN